MRASISSGLLCAAVLAVPAVVAAAPKPAQKTLASNRVRYEYLEPRNPDHKPLRDELRGRRFLEQFSEVLSVLKLPRTLTLTFAGCGESNAWYDPETTKVTFCYEYVDELTRLASSKDLGPVPLQEAREGPITFVMLHETGHAVFDLLQVPILGREEDAADIFAAVVLLRLGKGIALRTIRGAAWQYGTLAKGETPDRSDLADVHGLNAQRYFNLLCMAYGSDPEFFAGVVQKRYLPEDRAEGCAEEYQAALRAMKTLILPSIDAEDARRLRVKHGKRWELQGEPR